MMKTGLSTSKTSQQPFILTINVRSAKNLPVGDIWTSDPYVSIKIGNRVVGTTSTKFRELSPVWNEEFHVPLLHLNSHISFHIYDKDQFSKDDVLGGVTADISNLAANAIFAFDMPLQKRGPITPRGSLQFTLHIEKRDKIFHVKRLPNDQSSASLPENIMEHLMNVNCPMTIRQVLSRTPILQQEYFDWCILCDILTDIQSFLPESSRGYTADKGKIVPFSLQKPSPTFCRTTLLNLHTNTATCHPPLTLPYSILLMTDTHVFMIVTANQFQMWYWVRHLRRCYYYHNHASLLNDMHIPLSLPVEPVSGPISIKIDDILIHCHGKLNGQNMVLTCVNSNKPEEVLTLHLKNLHKIVISHDFAEPKEFDLQIKLLNGQLKTTKNATSSRRASVTEPVSAETSKASMPSSGHWYPGKMLVKGTKKTFGVAKTVIKGTVNVAADVTVTSAKAVIAGAQGVVSAAQSTLGKTDVQSYMVLHGPQAYVHRTDPLFGLQFQWNDEYYLPLSLDQVKAAKAHGIYISMMNGVIENEKVAGQKFIPLRSILSSDATSIANDSVSSPPQVSSVYEGIIPLEEEIGFSIHVISGHDLSMPPTDSALFSLSSLKQLNPIALMNPQIITDLIKPPTPGMKYDRDPYVKCSCVGWDGSMLSTNYLKSKVVKNSINPVWDEIFIISPEHGSHEAHYICISVRDSSRDGKDARMGSVFIPLEDFSSSEVVREYPIVEHKEMNPLVVRQGLGFLRIGVKRITEYPLQSVWTTESSTVLPATITIETCLRPINEYTTTWPCHCISTANMHTTEATSLCETFYLLPNYEGLSLLDIFDDIGMTDNGFVKRAMRSQARSTDVLEISVFENQRREYLPPYEFGYGNLSALERANFSDETGNIPSPYTSLEFAQPPDGYQWQSKWKVDKEYTQTDMDGWVYGIDFGWIMSNYRKGKSSTDPFGRTVRRRKWVRIAVRKQEETETRKSSLSHAILSRKDLLHRNQNTILLLCQERKELYDHITIPWKQVHSIDVVTPSVLCVAVTVHRYFGENNVGESIFREVRVELFVTDCPAQRLCILLQDRIQQSSLRTDILELTASGSMSGRDADSTATHMSFGSSTALALDQDILQLEDEVRLLEKGPRTGDSCELIRLLQHRISRLRLYLGVLLGAGLLGPTYDMEELQHLIQQDIFTIRNMYDTSISQVKAQVEALLETAEMRIRDYSLCGWAHQGEVLEACLDTIINSYYMEIIGSLGIFFDSKDALGSVKGNMAKMEFIMFFLSNDQHLVRILTSALRPYPYHVEPSPILSHSLNLYSLIEWYTEILRHEMLGYIDSIVQVNKSTNKESMMKKAYCLPWETLRTDTDTLISNVPIDVFRVISNYLKFNKSSLSAGKDVIMKLDENIRVLYVECYVRLATEYYKVVTSHCWSEPMINSLSADDADAALGDHMNWLLSLANDSYRILNYYLGAYNLLDDKVETGYDPVKHTIVADGSLADHMSVENSIKMSEQLSKVFKIYRGVIDIATDYVSCIVFKSFETLLQLRTKGSQYAVWHDTSEDIISILMDEIEYYFDGFTKSAEIDVWIKLFAFCLRKICVWYLSFLKESGHNQIVFSDEDCEQVASDCERILGTARKLISSNIDRYPNCDLEDRFSREILLLERIRCLFDASITDSHDYITTTQQLIHETTGQPVVMKANCALLRCCIHLRVDQKIKHTESYDITDGIQRQMNALAGGATVEFAEALDRSPEVIVFGTTKLPSNPVFDALLCSGKHRVTMLNNQLSMVVVIENSLSTVKEHPEKEKSGIFHVFRKKKSEESQSAKISKNEIIAEPEVLDPQPKAMQIIIIKDISVKNLFSLDMFGKCDVYVQLSLGGDIKKTSVIQNDINPTWQGSFDFLVTDYEMEVVRCQVMYKNTFRKDDLIGYVDVEMKCVRDKKSGEFLLLDMMLQESDNPKVKKALLGLEEGIGDKFIKPSLTLRVCVRR